MPVTLDTRLLRRLRTSLAELPRYRAHVGIFADHAARRPDDSRQNPIPDNPSLGAVHEFGLSFSRRRDRATTTIPRRSFLQMPLTLFLGPEILRFGARWAQALVQRGAGRMVALLGVVGEDVVQEAFSTGGFGQWQPLAAETIRRKGSSRILIESAQLRKSVSSRVI